MVTSHERFAASRMRTDIDLVELRNIRGLALPIHVDHDRGGRHLGDEYTPSFIQQG